MSKIKMVQIYDPALCCSTGVCGVEPDQQLLAFAADVEWLKQQGVEVERYNLAQQPMEFVNNPTVKTLLEQSGMGVLPLIIVDGLPVASGRYPTRDEMNFWRMMGAMPIQNVGGGCCCCG